MSQSYTVHLDGHLTSITSHPEGPWPRWEMARAVAIEHLENQVMECSRTLLCLRRAACFHKYMSLRGEMAADSSTD